MGQKQKCFVYNFVQCICRYVYIYIYIISFEINDKNLTFIQAFKIPNIFTQLKIHKDTNNTFMLVKVNG